MEKQSITNTVASVNNAIRKTGQMHNPRKVRFFMHGVCLMPAY